LADALANCAMNHKQDAVWESSAWQDYVFTTGRSRLQVHSDGGVRQNDACSATAFTVTTFDADDRRTVMYACCKYYNYRMSAFRAEAMAIHDALCFLSQYLSN
jgi:ribonuclease HI